VARYRGHTVGRGLSVSLSLCIATRLAFFSLGHYSLSLSAVLPSYFSGLSGVVHGGRPAGYIVANTSVYLIARSLRGVLSRRAFVLFATASCFWPSTMLFLPANVRVLAIVRSLAALYLCSCLLA